MSVGCSLIGYKTCIVAYADDIILLAPTYRGLQLLLDNLQALLTGLCLKVNADKSIYIVFKHKAHTPVNSPNVSLNGKTLTRESNCKYLGVFLNENSNIGHDIDRITNSFLKQFNGMYSKFYFVDRSVLFYLFKSYTSSFYGIEVWYEKILGYQLNRISVAYHKAVKRICGNNVWDSNHDACDTVGVHIFRHLLAKKLVCFWHRICNSRSSCLFNLRYYFRYNSCIFNKISSIFHANYSVDISSNPLCAILARIQYVQRNEPRSHYAGP